MKAIVNTGPGRLELLDRPKPGPGPGQVRIRTGACGICATDLEMIAGWDRTGFPSIPGHEWAGTVDAAGPDVDAALVGRRCVAENVWRDGGEVGFEHPGGYAEYFVTEADRVHLLPDEFPLATAALIEPLAVCVRGLRRLRYEGAGSVLIFGDGPIGLLMAALLAARGAGPITVVGGRADRLATAVAFGAAHTLNYHDLGADLVSALRACGAGAFQYGVEATGSAAAVGAAMALAAPGARLLIVGDYGKARAAFPWNDLLHRELELIGSNASAGAWPEAVRCAVDRVVPLERTITHRFSADRFEEGVALVRSRRSDVIKVVLDWENR